MTASARLLQLSAALLSLAAACSVTPNRLLQIHLGFANAFFAMIVGKG